MREEVIDAGFARDGGGGERIVAGDHHGADAHGAKLVEALAHAALHDVFQLNDAQSAAALLRDHQRRAAGARDLLDGGLHFARESVAVLREM